jgi:opacity protein-like surface antigen
MRALRLLLLGLLQAVLLAGIGTTASAQEDDEEAADYSRNGVYVAASGALVVERWTATNKDSGADDTFGFNFRVGARVNQWASVELELEVIDDFFPNDKADVTVVNVFANTRAYPLSGRLQPYALGGIGIVTTVVEDRPANNSYGQSNTDWGFRFGAGVDLYYTEHIALSVEAAHVWTVGDVKDIDHIALGVGILYRF